MQFNTRARLAAGGQSLAFLMEHPDPSPGATRVAGNLAALLRRGDELGHLQRTCQVTITATANLKDQLRRNIREDLGLLAGISRGIARDVPDMTVHLRLSFRRISEVTLITNARVAVAEAAARKALFHANGMPESLLDEMTRLLDDFDAAVARQRNAWNAQVGATAQLAAVGLQVMNVLRHLDALHRIRFRNDVELRAGWKSARKVGWPKAGGEATRAERPGEVLADPHQRLLRPLRCAQGASR